MTAELAGLVEVLLQATSECPGCIELSSPGLMTGMLAGMALMMAAPFLVIFGIGGGLLRARRQALARMDQTEDEGG